MVQGSESSVQEEDWLRADPHSCRPAILEMGLCDQTSTGKYEKKALGSGSLTVIAVLGGFEGVRKDASIRM